MSLRGRVLAALLVVVAVGLAASDVATYRALQTFLLDRVDAQVDSLRRPVIERLTHPGPGGVVASLEGGAGIYAEIRDPGGKLLVKLADVPIGESPDAVGPKVGDLPTPVPCGRAYCVTAAIVDLGPAVPGGPSYRGHVWSLPDGSGTLLVALPLKETQATLNQLLVIEALVSLAVLAAAATASLYLVRVGLRPLSEIEATAGAIAAGDLSQRIARTDAKTEVGRLGIALNAMLGQIEAAFAAKDASESRLRRFLADASHELRSPLTSIRGYSELFRRGAGDRPEDLAKVMARIEAESSRMGILVDDLLLLARLDQGRPLERAQFNLAPVVADAVEAARTVEPDREIDLESPERLDVNGDARRLRQVVDNLLANVRTHTPEGTAATVRLTAENGQALIEVADHGPGLPATGRELLFNRFYRADPARSRDKGGAGLGLSIVAAIVEAHGGAVTAEDRPGGGAVFRVELPTA